MRAWIAFAALFACIAAANAEAPTIEFDGSTFQLAYEDQATQENGDPGNGLAEFTLPDENVDNWSKLFAFHSFPTMGDNPLAAVQTVGKVVKETNPAANFAIIENKEKGEAIIDFLTWAPDSDVMEFNVFKYAPAADGQGLVAMQFAQHIKLGDISVEEMRALRTRAVEEMADTDIEAAQNYFESVGEKSGDSAAADSGSSTVARAGRKD